MPKLIEKGARVVEVLDGRATAASLLEAARAAGGPLVDAADSPDDAQYTFVWESRDGDGGDPGLFAAVVPDARIFAPMQRLPGSNVWAVTIEAPAAVRSTYGFLPGAPAGIDLGALDPAQLEAVGALVFQVRPDPGNPRTENTTPGEATELILSVLEGPDAPPEPYTEARADVPAGEVREHAFRSAIFGNERPVWTYRHPDASPDGAFLLLFDGQGHSMFPLATLLDNLTADGLVPPVSAVFVHSLGHPTRMVELGLNELLVPFLRDELLPWAVAQLPIRADGGRGVAVGVSLGGVAASFAALRLPGAFGGVLSLSGSFFLPRDEEPEWIVGRFEEADTVPARAHLAVGVLEPLLVPSNQRLRDTLAAKGTRVSYTEFCGGHDVASWRTPMTEGLVAILAR